MGRLSIQTGIMPAEGLKARILQRMKEAAVVGVDWREQTAGQGIIHTAFRSGGGRHSQSTSGRGASAQSMWARVRRIVVEAVTETVLVEVEPYLLRRAVAILRPRYDRDATRLLLSRGLKSMRAGAEEWRCERDRIGERVGGYLREYDVLDIDGFVRFRLQAYRESLMDCVRRIVDDYEAEQERREFISLLREFVSTHYAKTTVVHVLADVSRPFRIVDASGCPLPGDWDDAAWDEWSEADMDPEELLVASLISSMPDRIIVHLQPSRRMDLVTEVFAGRLLFCSGCRICGTSP